MHTSHCRLLKKCRAPTRKSKLSRARRANRPCIIIPPPRCRTCLCPWGRTKAKEEFSLCLERRFFNEGLPWQPRLRLFSSSSAPTQKDSRLVGDQRQETILFSGFPSFGSTSFQIESRCFIFNPFVWFMCRWSSCEHLPFPQFDSTT